MAPIGEIYTYPGHAGGNKARITAGIAGLELTLKEIKLYEDNKKPEFISQFPRGKVPAFKGSDGFLLTESTAIAKYVASLAPNSGLLGKDAHEAALVDSWLSYIDSELEPSRKGFAAVVAGHLPYTKPLETNLRERLEKALEPLNTHLQTTTFLVGHRITVADIVLSAVLQRIFEAQYGPAERAKIPNLVRLLETIANQPGAKPIVGELKYAEQAAQYTAPAKEKKEKSKPAQVIAAVKEKITGKPKAAEENEEEDEPAAPAEPKAKNPLDDLPKSSLNLEDWKRAYSNLDTRGPGGSLEWFYSKHDPEGYSIWKVKFKYPEELTQVFMSSNQIGGYFNRLEASRKYLFGSVGVLGESNNSLIEGVLIARGQDIIPVVNVAPDYESYEYEKIDLSNEAQKAFFEGALAWDLEVDGKKWADGKNFK